MSLLLNPLLFQLPGAWLQITPKLSGFKQQPLLSLMILWVDWAQQGSSSLHVVLTGVAIIWKLDWAERPKELAHVPGSWLTAQPFSVWLGFLTAWQLGPKRESSKCAKVEVAHLLQPSLGNYRASLPLHFIFQSKSQGEPRFKRKGRRHCLLMRGVARKFQPLLIDHSYQPAFIRLVAESISLNAALQRSRLPLHRDNLQWLHCQGGHLQLCPLGPHGRSWWIQPCFKYVNTFSHITDKSCRPRSHSVSLRWPCIALLWPMIYWLNGLTLRRQSLLPVFFKCLRKHHCSPLNLATISIKMIILFARSVL